MKSLLAAVLLLSACGTPPSSTTTPPPSPKPEPPVHETQAAPPAAPEPAPPPIYVDAKAIAAKSKAEAEGVLGLPVSCETVKPSGKPHQKCDYRDGNIEIVYTDDKADWITIYGADGPHPETALHAKFDPASISLIGLSGAPTAQSPIAGFGVFWKGSSEVRDLTMFGQGQGGDDVTYFYIKAITD